MCVSMYRRVLASQPSYANQLIVLIIETCHVTNNSGHTSLLCDLSLQNVTNNSCTGIW